MKGGWNVHVWEVSGGAVQSDGVSVLGRYCVSNEDINKKQDQEVNRFFSHFMRDHHKIYAFVLVMVHRHHDADDLMQETAIILWQKFSEYDEEKSFTAWGIGIARNVIRRYRDAQGRDGRRFRASVYEALERHADIQLDQFDAKMDALRDCVGKLTATDQDLVDQRYEQKLSVKTIAAKVHRSVRGLYQTYARIHALLEDCISRRLSLQEEPQ